MITGDRVRHARELRGLTQTELGRDLGVTQPAIARIENGQIQPSDELVEMLALKLGFRPAFFRRPSAINFPAGSLLYRAHASVKSKAHEEAVRYGQTLFEMAERLSKMLKSMPVYLQRHADDPLTAARLTRTALSLSQNTPIERLVHQCERSGVLILALPVTLAGLDAFSTWAGREDATERRPVIVTSSSAPGDRQRFTIAHELGHLVMHNGYDIRSSDLEDEANRFATELLVPEEAIRQEMTHPITLYSLANLKPRWKVSIQVLIRRARDLELISQRQYTYMFERLSKLGWKLREPSQFDVPFEKPRALRKMVEVVYGTDHASLDIERLCADEGFTTAFAKQILEAHATRSEMPPKGQLEQIENSNILRLLR